MGEKSRRAVGPGQWLLRWAPAQVGGVDLDGWALETEIWKFAALVWTRNLTTCTNYFCTTMLLARRPWRAGCSRLAGRWAGQRRWVGEPSGLDAFANQERKVWLRDPLAEDEQSVETVVDAYASWGFTVNGAALQGAVLLLPRTSMLFSPTNLSEIVPDSLEVSPSAPHSSRPRSRSCCASACPRAPMPDSRCTPLAN